MGLWRILARNELPHHLRRAPARRMDLYGAIAVKGLVGGHLLVRPICDISLSRPDFPADAARSGRQGWPKAIAQRLALDGREHSVKLPKSGDTSVSRSLSSVSTTTTLPRGARHRARVARHELVFGRPRRSHHDAVMRIGGEAPRGGPILNRGAKAIVQHRVAAASVRHLQPSVNATPGCSKLNGAYAAERSCRPAGVSPVVASRHNTMSSLRASATIIVLRVPPRPSDARFQNHSVRGLPF